VTAATKAWRIEPVLKQAAWDRRARYHGFAVLVASPLLTHSAAQLCSLYRAKDAVEKDFQVIKSVVQLRPLRHRTDAKIRAHVTLCMLSLLLERTLDRALRRVSAGRALETLAACRLNLYAAKNSPPAYVLTETDEEQRALLAELKLSQLAHDEHAAEIIQPRSRVL
jgi:hypothetical protein